MATTGRNIWHKHPPVRRRPGPRRVKAPGSQRRRRSQLRRLIVVVLVALVVLLSVLGFTLARLNATVTSYPGSHFNQGKNAVWLEHTWVGDVHSSEDFDALADQLERDRFAMSMPTSGP